MSKRVLGSMMMFCVFGCSSTSGPHPASGAGGSGGNATQTGGGSGGGAVGGGSTIPDDGECGPALADLPSGDLLGANGLAVVGTDVFVVTRGPTDHRIISLVKDGALTQVADVPSDTELIQTQMPGFYADADAFYIDAVSGNDRPLYRVDRKSGAETVLAKIKADEGRFHPLFLADDQYLYYEATDGNDTLTRVAKTGATPPEPLQQGEFDNQEGLDSALAVDDTNVYYLSGDDSSTGANFGLTIGQKTPASRVDFTVQARTLSAPSCAYDPWYLVMDSGTAYTVCRNPAQTEEWIYSFPPGAPESTTVGQVVVAKPGLHGQPFAVANGNVYYEAADGDLNWVFRMPKGGGTATEILKTESVDHMIASGGNLYVTSVCGVQTVPL